MKLNVPLGATSQIWQIFLQDSSSTTGSGLGSLVHNTSNLTCYYHRDTDTTATAVTLVDMTVGTFTSSGFKLIDNTNMLGCYSFCPPNAALTSGAKSVMFFFKGATNLAPLPLEVQLVSYDPNDSVRLGLTALPNAAAGANTGLPVVGTQVPNATAGASGGLLISGSNSGTTTFGALTVTGAVLFSSTFATTGTTTYNAFTVTNATTLSGAVSLGSTLGVSGTSTFAAINTGAIGTGNFTITGTLSTSGTTTFNALTVTNATTLSGAVSLGSTLNIVGATTLAALSTSGTATFNALTVTNATTLSGAVSMGSTFGITGTMTVNAFTCTNAFTVSGATTLTGAVLATNGSNDIRGVLATVSGTVTLAASQTFNNTGTWTGNLSGSVGSVTSGVTVTTNNDKTGYSLSGTQAFNLTGNITGNLSGSVGSVTAGVTVTTNNDKTGYSLTVTPPNSTQIATAVAQYDIGNGRTAEYFWQGGMNKIVTTPTTIEVYETDDTTLLVEANTTAGTETIASITPT